MSLRTGVVGGVALLLLGCSTALRAGVDEGLLRPAGSVQMPAITGRIDHFAADPQGKRLYLAALGNDSLEVIDVGAVPPRHLKSIKGLRKPTGVAFIPDLNRIAVASGDDGMCRFFDATTLGPAGEVRGLDDADNVRYDAAARRLYVGYGEGALAVIDPAGPKKLADIKLPAHPESFRLEEKGPRIFVNLPDASNAVAVVDRAKGAVVATWRPKEAAANFPLWLDEDHHRLLVGCRRPAKLLVLDTETGRTAAAVDCAGDADDLWYDPALRRIYVSGGAGAITVLRQTDPNHYMALGELKSAPGARTSLFVPATRRLYVAAPRHQNEPARVLTFEAPPEARS